MYQSVFLCSQPRYGRREKGREHHTDLPDWVHCVAAEVGDDPGQLHDVVLLSLLETVIVPLVLLVLHGAVKDQRHRALF